MLNYFQGLWTPLMGELHSIYLLPATFLVPNIKYSCYKKHKQQQKTKGVDKKSHKIGDQCANQQYSQNEQGYIHQELW